jgi:hypothetical protein
MPSLPLFAIVWDDAHSPDGAFTADELRQKHHKPVRFTTYGLVVLSDPVGVTIAQEEDQDGGLRGVTFIPRGMIVAETPVAKPRRSRRRTAPLDPPQPSPG